MREVRLVILSSLLLGVQGQYTADWTSLDARPLPTWYDQAKVGIFIHWGVFSVPSFGSEWFWHSWKDSPNSARYEDFMRQNYKPGFTYQDFASQFTAEFYNATEWAEIFQSSGAKYVVLTSKHHEGFTLWPSKFSFSWNAKEVGPHRDLVGELAGAIRGTTDLKFGLYHSLYEWYNPLWVQDKANNFSTNYFAHGKIIPEMKELIETYKPEVLWSDGEWEAADWYWNSTLFLQWLYNSSPVKSTVVTNDRWGHETLCKHGGFYTCADRYNPGVLQAHKWENCLTIDKESWGYRRDAKFADYMTFDELIKELVTTVSCGGNILINVGPTKEGIITPIYEERLRQLGDWLGVNGEAIYSSQPWTYQNETVTQGVWYTKRAGNVYASVLQWPQGGLLVLNLPEIGPNNQVSILGYSGPVKFGTKSSRGISIMLPDFSKVKRSLPWVIKLTNVLN